MKTIFIMTVGILLSANSHAGIFKSKNAQGKSDDVQVMVLPGRVAQTYNPKTGEVKKIKPKVNVKSEK